MEDLELRDVDLREPRDPDDLLLVLRMLRVVLVERPREPLDAADLNKFLDKDLAELERECREVERDLACGLEL